MDRRSVPAVCSCFAGHCHPASLASCPGDYYSFTSASAPVKDRPPRALRISLDRSSCCVIDRAKQILDTVHEHRIHTFAPTITKNISFCASLQKLRPQKAPSPHQHTTARAESCRALQLYSSCRLQTHTMPSSFPARRKVER
jgi:hypothetical protein